MSHSPRRRAPAAVLLTAAALVAVLLPTGGLFAQAGGSREPIVAVRVEGNETIPAAVILQHTTIRSGRPVTETELKEDVRSLYRRKWFSRIRSEVRRTARGPEVVFVVKELPQVRSVRYVGNRKKSAAQLAKVTGLEPGSPYRVTFNRDAAETIRRYYEDQGYRHARVTLERGNSPAERDVVFRIAEGPKVRVGHVSIEGNAGFSDALLKRDLDTKPSLGLPAVGPLDTPALPRLPLFGLWDPTTVPHDEAKLTDYYRDYGYFDVKVRAKVSESDDRSKVYVVFHVDEGPRYRVRSIKLQGNDKLPEDVLLPDPHLKPGDWYNARLLTKDRRKMEELYGAEGRLFTKIEPTPDFLDNPGQIDLTYNIREDKVRIVRHVNATIRGDHPHTQRSLIHNSMLVHPGDVADPELIRKSKSRIGGSPVFQTNVDLTVRPVEEDGVRPAGFRGQNPGVGLDPVVPRPGRFLPFVEEPAAVAEPQASWLPGLFGPIRPILPPAWEPSVPRFEDVQEAVIAPFAPPGTVSGEGPGAVIRGQSPPPRPAPLGGWRPGPVAPVAPGPPSGMAAPGAVVPADGAVDPFAAPPNPFRTIQQSTFESGVGTSNPLLPQSPQGGPFVGPFREQPGFVDIDVAATEERTGRLNIGAAVNSSSGLVGQVTLQEDNFDLFRFPRSFQEIRDGTAFRGRGQRLRIEAVPGSQVSRYLVSLTDPYFLDSQYSASASGFYYSRFYDEYDEQRLGGKLSVGRQLTPYWSVVGSSRLESVKIFDPDVGNSGLVPPKLAEAVGTNALFTVGASLKYDSRDRAILPSEGTFAEFGYTQGLGDFTYPQFDAEVWQYFTLAERPDGTGQHVLSLNGTLGIAGDDQPIYEAYYLGGFQTLRGYDFRGVSPLQDGVRVGGRFQAFGSVQYRFPILVNDALQGVVFTDFGTVNDSVTLDDFRATAGFGFRVSLPQAFGPAPLAFDFAFPVAGPDFDEEQIVSFQVGLQR